MTTPYFQAFEDRQPSQMPPMSRRRQLLWQFWAGATVAAGALYLTWRWGASLNPEAVVFSTVVALAETLFFLGTLLFMFDIWSEQDTPRQAPPTSRHQAGLDTERGAVTVDIFITTYDEPMSVVRPSILDAQAVIVPEGVRTRVWILDDGDRADMAGLAAAHGVGYFKRSTNEGFKAGNLRNGLLHTSGDFVVICDADTRLMPTFLQSTLGYFRDPRVAWVQTPHWFYDIPEGRPWDAWVAGRVGRILPAALVKALAWALRVCTGRTHVGADPFLADPSVFFDVIQRRRNRHEAAFCCGAGSIHRREAVFDAALSRKGAAVQASQKRLNAPAGRCLQAHPMEPYRFHVSEDIYTSILMQEAGWKSVYHPQIEARMLSPVSLEAWAVQRLKYAGGTFDIALRDNPLWRRGLSWQQKLHYAATFWSYFSLLWAPVLLLAPVVSLLFGVTPVKAYSMEFFAHFLPAVVLGELAILAACKGHAVGLGRALSVVALPVHFHALICVLRGRRPKFAPTPKLPVSVGGGRHVVAHWVLLASMAAAAGVGIWRTMAGDAGFSPALLWVNLFWLLCNMLLLAPLLRAARWRTHPVSETATANMEVMDGTGVST